MNGQRIRIKLRGFDYRVIDQRRLLILWTPLKEPALEMLVPSPCRSESRYTVNRSPHVDKKIHGSI